MLTARSVQGARIRLTDERWRHITAAHADMKDMQKSVLEVLGNPDRILQGDEGELIAIRRIGDERWLAVVYSTSGDDGFVITAFRVSRAGYFRQRSQVWP